MKERMPAEAAFARFVEKVGDPTLSRILDDVAALRKEFGAAILDIGTEGFGVSVHDVGAGLVLVEQTSGVHLLLLAVIEEAKRAGVVPEEVHAMFHEIIGANVENEEEHEARKAGAS